MTVYSSSARTTLVVGSGDYPAFEILPPLFGEVPVILEISYNSATGGFTNELSLRRATTTGIPFRAESFWCEESVLHSESAPSLTKLVVQWAQRPSLPIISGSSPAIRRSQYSTGNSMGALWTFPRGLKIPSSTSLVGWVSSGGTAVFDVSVVIDI